MLCCTVFHAVGGCVGLLLPRRLLVVVLVVAVVASLLCKHNRYTESVDISNEPKQWGASHDARRIGTVASAPIVSVEALSMSVRRVYSTRIVFAGSVEPSLRARIKMRYETDPTTYLQGTRRVSCALHCEQHRSLVRGRGATRRG